MFWFQKHQQDAMQPYYNSSWGNTGGGLYSVFCEWRQMGRGNVQTVNMDTISRCVVVREYASPSERMWPRQTDYGIIKHL